MIKIPYNGSVRLGSIMRTEKDKREGNENVEDIGRALELEISGIDGGKWWTMDTRLYKGYRQRIQGLCKDHGVKTMLLCTSSQG